ncbi:MAG: hypothetical protein AAFX81_16530 [Pseudomonadota bacterium]
MSDQVPWVIRKSDYFYRPNCAGLTACACEAGVYTEAEAKAEASLDPRRVSAHPLSEFHPRLAEMERRLTEIREIADGKADADQEPGGAMQPNDWMRVLVICDGEDRP